jgi:hypothetical protein
MSSLTCPLCGLRYPARPLLDLHIREDHARRDDKPAAVSAPAPPPATAPAPPPAAAPAPPKVPAPRPGNWAETARRALNRMLGRAA